MGILTYFTRLIHVFSIFKINLNLGMKLGYMHQVLNLFILYIFILMNIFVLCLMAVVVDD